MGDPLVLHAALLMKVETYASSAWEDNYPVLDALRALRDVVALHWPHSIGLVRLTDGVDVPMCHACSFNRFGQPLVRVGWADCLTIRAVAGELGVDLNE